MISRWATWTSHGIALGTAPTGPAVGALLKWPEASSLKEIHPRARRPHSTAQKLVQLAAHLLKGFRNADLGIVLGTQGGCALADREFQSELETKGWPLGGPSLFVYTLPTASTGELSLALEATGPMLTLNAGTASGLSAVIRAVEWVQAGRAPAVLAISAEMGVADEHVALFLVEGGPRRKLVGQVGFGEGASGNHSALDLAAALSRSEGSELRNCDERGYWASLRLEPTP